jgi:hypothetical protein
MIWVENIGDEISGIVIWKKDNVSSITGKTVKMRFVLKYAGLYSFRSLN